MAIEFHCPYCTAVMRVPDEFAAKKGRCPKCNTVVLVPDVRPPEHVRSTAAADAAGRVAESGTAPDSAAASAAQTVDILPDLETASTSASVARALRRRNRRRGPQRVWLVGAPVICFLLLLAAIGWYTVGRLPSLSGELPAAILTGSELPEHVIPWSMAGHLSDEQQAILRSELELAPEVFVSTQMRCAMQGTEDGIAVSLRTTDETVWYVVDPRPHPALVLWLRKHRDQLQAQRNLRFQDAFRQYCDDKLKVLAGELTLIDAERYRNAVGLEACCGGLGSVVEAVVRNRVVRCASEDESGRLYFCLPRGVVSFQLRGREFPDGTQPFGGQFEVTVAGTLELERGDAWVEDQPPDAESADSPNGDGEEESETDMSETAQPNDSAGATGIDSEDD